MCRLSHGVPSHPARGRGTRTPQPSAIDDGSHRAYHIASSPTGPVDNPDNQAQGEPCGSVPASSPSPIVGFIAQLWTAPWAWATASLHHAAADRRPPPAVASASVHFAELGTTLASGTAHWRFGNVDWKTVARLAPPGGIGGFLGAYVLSNVDATAAKPWVSLALSILAISSCSRDQGHRRAGSRPSRRGCRRSARWASSRASWTPPAAAAGVLSPPPP